MKPSLGTAPHLLLEQVRSTAAWALEADHTQASYRDRLLSAPALADTWQRPEGRLDYFAFSLACHFTTLCTYVPTDVDSQIRFHFWQSLKDEGALLAALDKVAEAASWPVPEVGDRGVTVDGEYISGHEGEWLAVRAGALGRAYQLELPDSIAKIEALIDQEYTRERRLFKQAIAAGDAVNLLKLTSIIAHNLGDLARVVETWPSIKLAQGLAARERYPQLGKTDPAFVLLGDINRDLMAADNHRFLPMREAKALRRARELLLPLGPFFDQMGEKIGASKHLDDRDLGEVVGAILVGHTEAPEQQGYLRMLAGIHRKHRGGIDDVASEVPARMRKTLRAGAVRPALDLDERRFNERFVTKFRHGFDKRILAFQKSDVA